jgi:hypothetical protein
MKSYIGYIILCNGYIAGKLIFDNNCISDIAVIFIQLNPTCVHFGETDGNENLTCIANT